MALFRGRLFRHVCPRLRARRRCLAGGRSMRHDVALSLRRQRTYYSLIVFYQKGIR